MIKDKVSQPLGNRQPWMAAAFFLLALLVSHSFGFVPTVGAVPSAVTQLGTARHQYGPSDTLQDFVVPPGTNRLLVVVASHTNSTQILSVTYFGGSMQQIVSQDDGFAVDSIWVFDMGTSAFSEMGDIVVTPLSGSEDDELFIAAVAYANVNQTSPADAVGACPNLSNCGQTSGSGPITSNLTLNSEDGDLVFDVFDAYAATTAVNNTIGAGQTLLHNQPSSSIDSGGFAAYSTSTQDGASSVTSSWTTNGEAIIHLAININAATYSTDTQPPSITAPADVTVEAPADTSPANTGAATASDDTDPNPVITFSDATIPGYCAANFLILREWRAEDAVGNSSTTIQTITSQDTTAPSITVPADINVILGDSTDPSNTGAATGSDAASAVTITFSDTTSGNVITRTWTAVDACGNSTSDDQLITIINPNVDLEITISDSPDPVVAGANGGSNNLLHTITVKNNGPATATNIVIQFGANTNPPPSLSFSTGSQLPAGNEWGIASLASGQAATLTMTFSIGSGYSAGNVSSNANVQSVDQNDTNSSNDNAAADTAVNRDVSLILTKSDDGATPLPGDVLVYTLSATNYGISDALGVIFNETVPPNTTFNAASSSAWSCSDGAPAGTTCTFDFGALANIGANGGQGIVTFAVNVAAGTGGLDVTNQASVADNSGAADTAEEVTAVINPDTDNDGVIDADDLCPDSSLTDDAPPSPKKNRFFVNADGDFVDGDGNFSGYTIADSGGCASKQIIETVGLGGGHVRFGISRSALEAWIASVP